MDLLKNLYVFPDAVSAVGGDDRLKLDIEKSRVTLALTAGERTLSVRADASAMRDGSCAMVVYSAFTGELYTLYDFRELLEVFGMAPSEFLRAFALRGYLQVDACGGGAFVKAFLPAGQRTLESSTHDLSALCHFTADMIHPLDWKYRWELKHAAAEVMNGILTVTLEIARSDFWTRDVYLSHGGQAAKVDPDGTHTYTFKYVPGEDAYLGEPNCRYRGRAIQLGRLLNEKMTGKRE